MKCFPWKIFVCKLCIPYQTFVSIERRRIGLFISHPPSFLLPIWKARMRLWIVLLSSTLLGYFVSNKFTAMQRTKESWIGLSVLCRWFTLLSLKFFKFEQLESRFLVFCAYFIWFYHFVSFFGQPITLLMDTNTGQAFGGEGERRRGLCFTNYSTDWQRAAMSKC